MSVLACGVPMTYLLNVGVMVVVRSGQTPLSSEADAHGAA
jgi:hypothetical protein